MDKTNLENASLINNEFYHDLGDRWYTADDDPVALLRAENKIKLPWILNQIQKKHKDTKSLEILDVGCGAGFATNYLSGYSDNITGVDLAEGALQTAKKFGDKKIKYICADANHLPFEDQKFDVVISLDFLEHVPNPAKIISEVSRVLKPGGLFFYHTFSKNWLSYLVVIKGVEWFVKNTPKHMHTYDLFINHNDVKKWCQTNNLDFKEVTGIKPKINKSFFNLIRTGIVPKNFEFETTNSLLVSYLGYATKRAIS